MKKDFAQKEREMGRKAFCAFIAYTGKLMGCILAGILLLVGVYALPVERMKANVARSSGVIDYEGIYPQMSDGYKYMQLDNFTDSIMLGAAVYDGAEGILDRAMSNYHMDCDELSPELALTNYANDVPYGYYPVSYGRYWHGYLVPLKLLLLFLDYSDIRVLNFFVQNALLFLIIRRLYKNRMERYAAAFAVAVFLINPLTAALSLQFSTVYYIVLFSVIYLLGLFGKKEITDRKTDHMFFLTGVCTSYFDFLTYPLAVFGILVIFYLNISLENGKRDGIKSILKKMALWFGGYGGMWGGKWLAGSILLRKNMFMDAMKQAFVRTSSNNVGGGKI